MVLTVKGYKASTEKIDFFGELIAYLEKNNYDPVIANAKSNYYHFFGIQKSKQETSQELVQNIENAGSRMYQFRSKYRSFGRTTIAGDFFFFEKPNCYLYILISKEDKRYIKRENSEETLPDIEFGYIGDEKNLQLLKDFKKKIDSCLSSLDISLDWDEDLSFNYKFYSLSKNKEIKFNVASELKNDFLVAGLLEDESTRALSIGIRKSGGMLAHDLTKKGSKTKEKIIEKLIKANLIERKFVVICKKTSNQILKAKSREIIEQSSDNEMFCSCGKSLKDERIEELFTATPRLQKMLDKSYWMTAKFVHILQNFDIPEDKILINIQDGAEEIDAFVNLEGRLMMFELKDCEFSLGHAYSFGSRMSLYNPDFAFIVSTKGISKDVIEHFKKTKQLTIFYINNLDELHPTIQQLIHRIRLGEAFQIFGQLDPLTGISISITDEISKLLK